MIVCDICRQPAKARITVTMERLMVQELVGGTPKPVPVRTADLCDKCDALFATRLKAEVLRLLKPNEATLAEVLA